MPSHTDDWSDSDDGPVDDVNDISDAAVSRIGGHPAFLPSREPPLTTSQCKICSFPMQLLLQIWCPFEDSPMDRALYVWGCSRGACQKKDGSIRAWRGLRFNEKYATKLEKKLTKKRERERAKAEAEAATAAAEQAKKATPKVNPFSISTSASTPAPTNPFALGNQIFGGTPAPSAPAPIATPNPEEQESEEEAEDSGDDSDASEQSLTVALASTTLEDSPWKAAPAYEPLYLSTTSEYLHPQPKSKLPANVQVVDPDSQDRNDPMWNNEAYENSLEIDNVFDRFAKRVSFESEQCLRYNLNGTPLPFAKDSIFDKLFPLPTSSTTTISKSVFQVTPPIKRTYSPSASALIPPCPICKSSRIFECQLMPNLINVLKSSQGGQSNGDGKKKSTVLTDEERKKAVEKALKSGDGMSWGTVMIFSCEKNCCLSNAETTKEAKECWREEVVVVQWDT
ncbi:hypothetical protein D9756_002543 [Leucocoprinus leucothites]|uniref:Programmed cell death protein 2 C-terminal domain-containing protein n=1 Tax=Leucocoprinus leucothites TaxID=201217 RepID=A0A8H5GC11_9AGAR|nr:hypothetical protein D9756_002543 [Leucoagaricus leucothites]